MPTPGDVLLTVSELSKTPVTAADVSNWTAKNPLLLSIVYCYIMHGWPNSVQDQHLTPYEKRNELSVENGYILRGSRVVIPPVSQSLV